MIPMRSLPRPALRPLSCGVLLALTTLSAHAGVIEDETVDVIAGDTVESWELRNGAKLRVNDAETLAILAIYSTVTLRNSTVAADGIDDLHALELRGGSELFAVDSQFKHGGLLINGSGHAELHRSRISLTTSDPGFDRLSTIGINIVPDHAVAQPKVWLDNSDIEVADNELKDDFFSGVGISQGGGTVEITGKSLVATDNIGVLMRGMQDMVGPLSLTLDNAEIVTQRGAAIRVAPGETASNNYYIRVANGARLQGGDGHLLHVGGNDGSTATGRTHVTFSVDNADLAGDVRFDPDTVSGSLSVGLFNEGHITGRFFNVSSASIDTGGGWTLTGDSNVGRLHLADGTVTFGDGTGFNTLSLDSFVGAGGTLVFNTSLGDDASATDRLIIAGDAEGQARVRVRNAGGQGAQTEHGIELITVGGASHAQFDLVGRAVGGQYEYFLFKAADGNWYLRSQLNEEPGIYPDPCESDPSLCDGGPDGPDGPDEPPAPVLRPETGAWLANDAAMQQLLHHRAADRRSNGDIEQGPRAWAHVDSTRSRVQATGQQTLRNQHNRLQVGADIASFDAGQGQLGVLLGTGQARTTSQSRVTGYRAHGEVEGAAVGLYASWSNGATQVGTSAQRGRFINQIQGEGLDLERYRSHVTQASVEAGHRFDIGQIGPMALSLQPELQLTWSHTNLDLHVERNGTVVERIDGNGLTTRVGVRLEGGVTRGAVRWQPYLALNVVHAADIATLAFDGEWVDGGAPRRRAELNAGTQLQWGNGLSAWAGLTAARGSERYQAFGGKAGFAYRW